ncbi:Regulator of G-protein signaling 7 [Thoreauomyces humboldtii]|nr:Regulator of G-protein signaling 7 [Thoreauomyces humboldtii]
MDSPDAPSSPDSEQQQQQTQHLHSPQPQDASNKGPVSDRRPAPARLTSLKRLARPVVKVSADTLPETDSEPASPNGSENRLSVFVATSSSPPVSAATSPSYRAESPKLVTSSTPGTSRPGSAGSSTQRLALAQDEETRPLYSLPPGYRLTVYDQHISRMLARAPNRLAPGERRWTKLESRRMKSLSELIFSLQDPKSGIELKDRKKMFKVYPNCFIGSELLEWVINNCNLLSREEALRFCGTLFREGYFMSVELSEKFTADSSLYIFQSPFYFPQESWTPSDFDYTVYLLKRSMHATAKYLLHDWEEDRLFRMQDVFYEIWDQIEGTSDDHLAHMKNALSKPEVRVFRLQEYTYWKTHRPEAPIVNPYKAHDKNSKNNFKTDDAFEATLTNEQLLEWLERRTEYHTTNLSINRLKVSQAAKTLVQRCEIWRKMDPMLETPPIPNPWVVEEWAPLGIIGASSSTWAVKKNPTSSDIRIWMFSFAEMMRDPIGVKHFYDFVQKEFSQENLEFYLKCQALDSISTRVEFTKRARVIYAEFVQIGASRELNINSSDRNAIISQFEALDTRNEPLSYYVFADALKHISGLMAKDSYVRFCSSKVVENALQKAEEAERKGGSGSGGGGGRGGGSGREEKEGQSTGGKKNAMRLSRDTLVA